MRLDVAPKFLVPVGPAELGRTMEIFFRYTDEAIDRNVRQRTGKSRVTACDAEGRELQTFGSIVAASRHYGADIASGKDWVPYNTLQSRVSTESKIPFLVPSGAEGVMTRIWFRYTDKDKRDKAKGDEMKLHLIFFWFLKGIWLILKLSINSADIADRRKLLRPNVRLLCPTWPHLEQW